MEPPVDVLLFGDQTGDYPTVFRNVLQIKDDVFLNAFFDKAYLALREEISHQPSSVQKDIPSFSSINDLVRRYAEPDQPRVNALDSVLTTISQFACFLSYQSNNTEGYPSPSRTRTVGSCTGSLAAAAISSCCSTVDLLDVAIDVTRVAFRVGALVSETAAEIERSTVQSPSWSVIVPNLKAEDAKEVLDSLHESEVIPPCKFAYISATTSNGVTISGPHHVLDTLVHKLQDRGFKPVRLPIHGPYHAPHLFNDVEYDRLLQDLSTKTLEKHELRIPTASTSDSNWRATDPLGTALRAVIQDMLVNPLRWDLVIENVASMVHERGDFHCNVIQLGPSNAKKSLITALKGKNLEVTSDDRFVHGLDHPEDQERASKNQPKIAICGLSGRFPNAADHEAFWKLLEKGMDLHRKVPMDRFDVKTHVDPDGKRTNTSHTPYGCFIDEPGLFDPKFFNMSPREAMQTDPMHRLALVTAYEALEMSGFVENRTPSTKLNRVGTFYGQTSDDWREIQEAQKIDTYFIPGGVRAFAPGRINYFFNFSGPSYSVDTACSSSLAAIQLACTALWARDCDTALAGGMNVLTNPDIFSGLSRGQFLSKKGPCATFDNEADGYCRGEGVGSVVLKRLEDAEADNDPILAVILGTSTNHSAEAVSITHPHAGAQEFLYKKVLNNAGVDPFDISYVEMHGTGTQAGDAIEMQSVLGAFAPEHLRRGKDQSLHLGAVKANAGHGEAASGINSLIKVLTMLDKETIPPHCGIKGDINRTFPKDLDDRNVFIAREAKPWKRIEGKKRRLFLNNFSAAGGNTALLLEEGTPTRKASGPDGRSHHLITATARTKVSVKRNAEQLLAYLDANPDVSLGSLSYTTTARRTQHTFRISVSGADVDTIKKSLKTALDKEVQMIPKVSPKICVMFTGQGSHYISMAKQLFDVSPKFKSTILKFEKSVKMQGFPSILPLIDGSETELSNLPPLVVQLGAVCVQMALFRLYRSWGVEPTIVVGHSLGEYSALYAAGVLSATDTIYLCGTRARLLQEKCEAGSHSMVAVRASVAAIGEHLDRPGCAISCINGPEQTVIGGSNDDMEKLTSDLKDAGFKADKLPVPFAFHSAQVEPILEDFEAAAKGVTFNKPSIPVISPLLNNVVIESHEPTFSASYLRNHCRNTVNFLGGIEAAKHAGLVNDGTVWLEIGAHPLCTGMVKATLGPKIKSTASLRRNEDDWKIIADSMCTLNDVGLSLDWNTYHDEYRSQLELLKLPTYQWDSQNYWIQYQNDWAIAKGNPDIAAQIPKLPEFSAASVHRIAEIDLDVEKPFIVGEADLTEPLLKEVIEGHEVNGLGLSPPSLYCDMAMTLAKHLYELINPDKPEIGLNAVTMKVEKPLILADKGPQLFHIVGTYDKEADRVAFEFYTLNGEGKRTTLHAACGVKYEDKNAWQPMWGRTSYMIKTCIERLRKGVDDGDNDLIKRGMAYKLFTGLINYGYKYRGMEEVVLDNDGLEATASVKFQTDDTDKAFLCSPYRTDSVAHLSGFIMLGNRNAETSKEVYVSHGWDNYRVAKPLECGKQYRSYVKMQQENSSMVVGDLYVFEGDDVVSVVEGLRASNPDLGVTGSSLLTGNQFHKMPRQLMDSLLAAASGKPKAMPKPAAASAPKQQPKPKAESAPAKEPAKAAPAKPASSGVTTKALEIIAEEVGVTVSDLSDESSFADLGVDSLLSLNISGKFRESCDLDVQSTIFVDYPTVKAMKGFLAQHDGGANEGGAEPEPAPAAQEKQSTPPTDDTSSDSSAPASDNTSASSATSASEDESPPKPTNPTKTGNQDLLKTIHSTVAGELGVEPSDLDAGTDLASLGMDSLMSLNVLGKLREATGQDLPSDFFANNSTMGDVDKAIGGDEVSGGDQERQGEADDAERVNEIEANESGDGSSESKKESEPKEEEKLNEVSSTESDKPAEESENSKAAKEAERQEKEDSSNETTSPGKEPENAASATTETDNKPSPSTDPTSTYPPATSILLARPSPSATETTTQTLFLFPDGSGSATSYSPLPFPAPHALKIHALNSPFVPSTSTSTHPSPPSTLSIPDLAQLYLHELLRLQPSGPYILGGWSLGGVLAYEASHQLTAQGRTVSKVLMLDSPSPTIYTGAPLPGGLHRWLADVGVIGPGTSAVSAQGVPEKEGRGKGSPEWLISHFDASLSWLKGYGPPPPPPARANGGEEGTQYHILWAANGVCHADEDPKPPSSALRTGEDEEGKGEWKGSTAFLLRDRGVSQEGEVQGRLMGWEEVMLKGGEGGERVKVDVLEGVNHFSMMKRGEAGGAERVGKWIVESVSSS